MKSLSEIELELSKLGIHGRFWSKPEINELPKILQDEETITNAASGHYQGGFAFIVTTNHRLLLVDKKLWFMSLEDIRFDMITEVDFSARIFDATISVRTINKVLRFTSIHQKQLRNLTRYLQQIILEMRQMMMQQTQAPPVIQTVQMPVQQVQSQFAAPFQQVEQQQPVQFYSAPISYTRPSRLRRVGALPTASLTMQQQRYR